MSWPGARKDAQRWLDSLKLPLGELQGKTVDLNPHTKSLRGETKYRAMILTAAKRILFAQGIVATVDMPKRAADILDEELPKE